MKERNIPLFMLIVIRMIYLLLQILINHFKTVLLIIIVIIFYAVIELEEHQLQGIDLA